MSSSNRRRSIRHVLGGLAEVHIGPKTVMAAVRDVSQHGMGILLPSDTKVGPGDTVWLLVEDVADYAITAVVRWSGENGLVGLEFEEVLEDEALAIVEALPPTEDVPNELANGELDEEETSA